MSEPMTTIADGPHPVDRHVGRQVTDKRIELGYNQSDLGRALGLTFQQVQKYEKGANRISASKLWMVARFFKVDIEPALTSTASSNRTARRPVRRSRWPA